MLSLILENLSTWLAGIGGVLVAIVGAFLAGRRKEKNKQKMQGMENRIKREEIEDEVSEMDTDTRSNKLREWMRD